MTLGQLFSGITDIPQELTERVVSGVTSDNREVEPGFLFVCVKGRSFDGHSVAASMLEKGDYIRSCSRRSTADQLRSSAWARSPAPTARPPR